MIAFEDLSLREPAFKSCKATQGSTHCHNLKLVGPVEYTLYSLELGYDCLEKVASLLILHQVKLIDYEVLNVEEKLFFYKFIQKTVCLFNCADC